MNPSQQKTDISAAVEKLRERLQEDILELVDGRTYYAVSLRAGMNVSWVSKILSGENLPRITSLVRIADAFGYEVRISFRRKQNAEHSM